MSALCRLKPKKFSVKKSERDKKVLVAMSGGVDSSVAAFLLHKDGYCVAGTTMQLGIKGTGNDTAKCGGDAVSDARNVCNWIGIPHYTFDFAEVMEAKVIGKFISEYVSGRTPNPCVDCNEHLKFGLLMDRAKEMGFDCLATGHYAIIDREENDFVLKKPKDRKKDQTYFLYAIGRKILDSVLFPLGNLTKEEVRKIAEQQGMPVAEKPESQDICFIGHNERETFFSDRLGNIPTGQITDRSGRVLGMHKGIVFYTIGQRGGLGISHPTPLYVIKIDPDRNRIVVGEKEDLRSRGLVAGNLKQLCNNWPERAQAKIRYRKKEIDCRIAENGHRLEVSFDEDQEAVTPGQSVVFYDRDILLGGGIIEGAIDGDNR